LVLNWVVSGGGVLAFRGWNVGAGFDWGKFLSAEVAK
jgi:hypothetical protein